MSETINQANINLVRRYLEACDGHDLDTMMALIDDRYAWRTTGVAGPIVRRGRHALRRELEAFMAAIPDLRVTILDIFGSGDRVAVRLREHGHHTGAPLLGVLATGTAVQWFPFDVYRTREGRLAEEWFSDESLVIREQLVRASAGVMA